MKSVVKFIHNNSSEKFPFLLTEYSLSALVDFGVVKTVDKQRTTIKNVSLDYDHKGMTCELFSTTDRENKIRTSYDEDEVLDHSTLLCIFENEEWEKEDDLTEFHCQVVAKLSNGVFAYEVRYNTIVLAKIILWKTIFQKKSACVLVICEIEKEERIKEILRVICSASANTLGAEITVVCKDVVEASPCYANATMRITRSAHSEVFIF